MPENTQEETIKTSSSSQRRNEIRGEDGVATYELNTQGRSKRKIRKKVFDDYLETYGKVNYQCPVPRCGKRCVNYKGLQSHCLIRHGLQLKKNRAKKYLIGNAPKDRQVKNSLVAKCRKGSEKYICTKGTCRKISNSFTSFYSHMLRLHGERISVRTCQGQDVTCNNSNNETDKCPICGRDKVDEYHLKNHDKMIYLSKIGLWLDV